MTIPTPRNSRRLGTRTRTATREAKMPAASSAEATRIIWPSVTRPGTMPCRGPERGREAGLQLLNRRGAALDAEPREVEHLARGRVDGPRGAERDLELGRARLDDGVAAFAEVRVLDVRVVGVDRRLEREAPRILDIRREDA